MIVLDTENVFLLARWVNGEMPQIQITLYVRIAKILVRNAMVEILMIVQDVKNLIIELLLILLIPYVH